MKFRVNSNCIGCGLCCSTCPKVFAMSDEGVAVATDEDVVDEIASALEAQSSCPVAAIESE